MIYHRYFESTPVTRDKWPTVWKHGAGGRSRWTFDLSKTLQDIESQPARPAKTLGKGSQFLRYVEHRLLYFPDTDMNFMAPPGRAMVCAINHCQCCFEENLFHRV